MSGSLIDKNKLNNRQKKNGMFNFIKRNTVTKNVQPKIIPNPNCPPTYNCSDRDLRDKRVYKASFRQPIKAVRKMTNCNENNNIQCQTTTKLYKDHYSLNDKNTLGLNCPNLNGSLPTSRLSNINLDGSIVKSKSGITTRTSKPLIRSGMQPNTAGQQNSGLNSRVGNAKRNTYSYSFRELLNNRRKSTIEKSKAYVTKETAPSSSIFRYGYGGNCNIDKNCTNGRVVERLNNKKFYKQGAVESSSRLERLKLETIRGQTNCPEGLVCQKNENSNCNGPNVPFVRAQMGPPVSNSSCTRQRKYKALFNINHTEVNYPQTSALTRARGAVSNKTTFNPNGGVCCNDNPKQLLK